jgi:hypothetical protein
MSLRTRHQTTYRRFSTALRTPPDGKTLGRRDDRHNDWRGVPSGESIGNEESSMFRKRFTRALVLATTASLVVAATTFANTDLTDPDRAIVGNADATPVALECGGASANITLRVIANNGANNNTTAAERSVTAPTSLTVTDAGLSASGSQTQSFRDTTGGQNYSQLNDILDFTIAVNAAASAPAGASNYAITFSESGAGMVNLGSKVDLGTGFTNPLLYVDVTCAAGYTTNGFFRPVDMGGVLNKAKAGQTIPLKFDIIDANDSAVADRTDLVGITVRSINCTQAGTTTDVIEEYSQSASGLRWDATAQQYVFNFATQKSWAGTCKTVTLSLDGDEAAVAYFNFTK